MQDKEALSPFLIIKSRTLNEVPSATLFNPRFSSVNEFETDEKSSKFDLNPIKQCFPGLTSPKDKTVESLYNKLVLVRSWSDIISKSTTKTKDPVIDLCTQITTTYGIRLRIIYADKQIGENRIEGIKDLDTLHRCLMDFVETLIRFPVNFIQKLNFHFLCLCQDVVQPDGREDLEHTLESILVNKHYRHKEDLFKHVTDIIFSHFIGFIPEAYEACNRGDHEILSGYYNAFINMISTSEESLKSLDISNEMMNIRDALKSLL